MVTPEGLLPSQKITNSFIEQVSIRYVHGVFYPTNNFEVIR